MPATTPPASGSEHSTPPSPAGSLHSPVDVAAAQAQLIDERIAAALARLIRGPGGIPGFQLAAMHTPPGFFPTITVNTGTNSELKKLNFKKVTAVKPVFDVVKFSQTRQPLDVDTNGRTTSFNMEHAADLFRRLITAKQG